jgi:hypothetical protein
MIRSGASLNVPEMVHPTEIRSATIRLSCSELFLFIRQRRPFQAFGFLTKPK